MKYKGRLGLWYAIRPKPKGSGKQNIYDFRSAKAHILMFLCIFVVSTKYKGRYPSPIAMKPRPERVWEVKIYNIWSPLEPFFYDFQCFDAFLKHKRKHETCRISGGPWALSGLGQALPDAIQWLPRVQDEERENHPHRVVNSSIKEALEMDHHRWI